MKKSKKYAGFILSGIFILTDNNKNYKTQDTIALLYLSSSHCTNKHLAFELYADILRPDAKPQISEYVGKKGCTAELGNLSSPHLLYLGFTYPETCVLLIKSNASSLVYLTNMSSCNEYKIKK